MKRILFALALTLGAITAIPSCSSVVGIGNNSSSFASTEIHNASRSRVRNAVVQTFRAEGFSLIYEKGNSLRFQKWGGTSAELIYGSWYTEGVAVEPEVEIVELGGNSYAVLCDVFMREHSGSSFDANYRILATGKMAYDKLMKKIKKIAETPS
ncbi:hypothetical protein [Rubritalea marina]|uniref:hypothetical protein n=1 Tax=Rubritalea marina TaxID=361055 RepID=UPI00037854E7|nr:hypothetical protein [Rubritalea marina]